MTGAWPPLDAHAHVDPSIEPTGLLALRAVVFAATTRLSDFMATASRDDPIAVWGAGVHPGVGAALEEFSTERLVDAIRLTPLVSEVGIDARSPVSTAVQRRVFEDILEAVADNPRIISVHSTGATRDVLDAIDRHRVHGIVLHWWRGRAIETARAVELGCWFSINQGEVRRPRVLGKVPPERLLTETDHPYGDRSADIRQPGAVESIEAAIERCHPGCDARLRVWRNASQLVSETNTLGLFPRRIQGMLRAAVFSGHDDTGPHLMP